VRRELGPGLEAMCGQEFTSPLAGRRALSQVVFLFAREGHRLVHEGGWQVVKAGREFRFVPPERVVMRRARGPGVRWAA
jgi:hypothetical protein